MQDKHLRERPIKARVLIEMLQDLSSRCAGDVEVTVSDDKRELIGRTEDGEYFKASLISINC